MELTEYITDLLTDFDEMGFAPTTTVPNPDAYAIEWRNKITKAFNELTEENERLRAENEIKSQKRANIFEISNAFDRGRTDGIRKMHSMLCQGRVSNDTVVIVANQIAKEMVEGE